MMRCAGRILIPMVELFRLKNADKTHGTRHDDL